MAADVQEPGDRIGQRQHRGIGLGLRQLAGDIGDLLGCHPPRELRRMSRRRRIVLGRPVAPQTVDQIGLDCPQRRAALLAGLAQPLGGFGSDQPGIVAEHAAEQEVLGNPLIQRLLDRMDDGEDGGIDLLPGLDRVAPVGEQDRLVLRDQACARRAAEAGEPTSRAGDVLS